MVLKNRIRGSYEALPELAQSVQRFIRQAYPEASPSVRDVLEKDYFLDAITDTAIAGISKISYRVFLKQENTGSAWLFPLLFHFFIFLLYLTLLYPLSLIILKV